MTSQPNPNINTAFEYIRTYRADWGRSPSLREIGRQIGASKYGARQMVEVMVAHGAVSVDYAIPGSIVPLVDRLAIAPPPPPQPKEARPAKPVPANKYLSEWTRSSPRPAPKPKQAKPAPPPRTCHSCSKLQASAMYTNGHFLNCTVCIKQRNDVVEARRAKAGRRQTERLKDEKRAAARREQRLDDGWMVVLAKGEVTRAQLENVLALAAAQFGAMTVGELLADSRTRPVPDARAVAAAALYGELNMGVADAGRVLGRHHTTILHALHKVGEDGELEEMVAAVRTALHPKVGRR